MFKQPYCILHVHVRMWHPAGSQSLENCLSLILGCLLFSCKWIKIPSEFTNFYANTPRLITEGVEGRFVSQRFPHFKVKNPKYNGLLLICNLKVLNPIVGGKKKSVKLFSLGAYLATVVVPGCWVGKMYPPLRCSPIFSAGVGKLCQNFLIVMGSP